MNSLYLLILFLAVCILAIAIHIYCLHDKLKNMDARCTTLAEALCTIRSVLMSIEGRTGIYIPKASGGTGGMCGTAGMGCQPGYTFSNSDDYIGIDKVLKMLMNYECVQIKKSPETVFLEKTSGVTSGQSGSGPWGNH